MPVAQIPRFEIMDPPGGVVDAAVMYLGGFFLFTVPYTLCRSVAIIQALPTNQLGIIYSIVNKARTNRDVYI